MIVERSGVATAMFVRLGTMLNRTFVLPLLIFYPTSRCNSRCVSCDWWRHSGDDDLSIDDIEAVAADLPALGTSVVAFSGGEPLLRQDVFDAAAAFRSHGLTLQLLTSGVLLERYAEGVAEHFTRVYVSLDAATPELYERVRGINALQAVGCGVARLREVAPALGVTARATLHRANFRELPRLIEHAKKIGVDGISFLAADTGSGAFGRDVWRSGGHGPRLALDRAEVAEFESIVERTLTVYRADFESGFIAESADKLRRLPKYYAALAGDGPFPPVHCNAPWVSAVLEANGDVRPCFFHPPIGTIRRTPIQTLLTRHLREFRATLDVDSDPTCARCVCTLSTGWRTRWPTRS